MHENFNKEKVIMRYKNKMCTITENYDILNKFIPTFPMWMSYIND